MPLEALETVEVVGASEDKAGRKAVVQFLDDHGVARLSFMADGAGHKGVCRICKLIRDYGPDGWPVAWRPG